MVAGYSETGVSNRSGFVGDLFSHDQDANSERTTCSVIVRKAQSEETVAWEGVLGKK